MLILTRKLDEIIVINDTIFIEVVRIEGNKVRLGITAPDSVKVYRKEIWDKINELHP